MHKLNENRFRPTEGIHQPWYSLATRPQSPNKCCVTRLTSVPIKICLSYQGFAGIYGHSQNLSSAVTERLQALTEVSSFRHLTILITIFFVELLRLLIT